MRLFGDSQCLREADSLEKGFHFFGLRPTLVEVEVDFFSVSSRAIALAALNRQLVATIAAVLSMPQYVAARALVVVVWSDYYFVPFNL